VNNKVNNMNGNTSPKKAPSIDTLQLIRDLLEKKKEAFNREQQRVLRMLYSEVPGLDFIPKRLWDKVSDMLRLQEVKKGKRLIKHTDTNLSCYVVLTGLFEIRAKNHEETVGLEPGMICGDFHNFTGKHWKSVDVVALENSFVAEFSPDPLYKLILEENSNSQFKALITFLTESIPSFSSLTRHSQERLAGFFKERNFAPRQLLIKENSPANTLYLIREGMCNVVSFNSPLVYSKLFERNQIDLRAVKMLKQTKSRTKGYMCRSTNIYQYNMIGPRNWIGDEAILNAENFRYSVIAKTYVTALEIALENLLKLPKMIIDKLEQVARAKDKIFEKRKLSLELNLTNIYNMNPEFALKKNEKLWGKEKSLVPLNSSENKKTRVVNSSIKLRADLFAVLKPRRKVLSSASLFNSSGDDKRILPIIFKKSLIADQLKLMKISPSKCMNKKTSMERYKGDIKSNLRLLLT